MKALIKDGKKVGVLPHPRVELEPGQVRVQVARAGFCPSDLWAARGQLETPPRLVLGHELSGTVSEVGEDAGEFRPGQRVAVFPWSGCNLCRYCAQGDPLLCAQARRLGWHRDGAFCEELAVEASMLYELPEAVSLELATLASALAAGQAAVAAAGDPGGRGGVVGKGCLVELTLRLLRQAGYRRAEWLRDGTGYADGQLDYLIDVGAEAADLERLVRLLRPRGRWIVRNQSPQPLPLDLRLLLTRQIQVFPVAYADFGQALASLADPALDLESLLGEIHPLEDWPLVFAEAEKVEGRRRLFSLASA